MRRLLLAIVTMSCGGLLALCTVHDVPPSVMDSGSDTTAPAQDVTTPDVALPLDAAIDALDATTIPDASTATAATLFLPSYPASALYRYDLAPDASPLLSTTSSSPNPCGVALTSTGELLLADLTGNQISRFTTPFATLMANGTLKGVSGPQALQMVDDELWVGNTGTANVLRFSFPADGGSAYVGAADKISFNGELGFCWVPSTRDLYFNANFVVNHYRVSADRTSLTPLPTISAGMTQPHGIVMAPWDGEIFVSDPGSATVFRFLVDNQGNATANGTLTGNGVVNPIGLAFAPWGELFVANNTGVLSRFMFNSSHAAIANGTFKTAANYLNWMLITP